MLDEKENAPQTEEIGTPVESETADPTLESAESKNTMTKDQVGFGVDPAGFWHFVIHEEKGFDNVLGFLLRMQDVVKAHYIGKAKAAIVKKEVSHLIRPDNIDAVTRGVKKGRWR